MAGKTFYGIDLGTTHTVVVKASKEGRAWKYTILKLENMPINDFDEIKETKLLPSAVYFGEDGKVIVGEYAKEFIHVNPERVYINAKIDLGGRLKRNQVIEHTPQEVSKEILKVCFSKIVEDGGENALVRISVPAAFSQDKRKDTIQAAENAAFEMGYKNLKIVSTTEEPFAAFVNLVVNESQFDHMIKNEKNTVMLIDIGGGTMDIIICDISVKENNVLNAEAPHKPAKHDEFAGARFDYELMKKFMRDFLEYYELRQCEVPEQDLLKLEKRMLLIAEDAKKFLCRQENRSRIYEFTCDFDNLRINLPSKAPFKISMSKKQMDMALDTLLLNSKEEYGTNQSIKKIIMKTLLDNKLTAQDIDCVYLTGGMANYDQISNTIKTVIQKPVIVAEEPLYCTAIGVALSLVIQDEGGRGEIKVRRRAFKITRKQLQKPIIIPISVKAKSLKELIELFKKLEKRKDGDQNQNDDNGGGEIKISRRMGISYYIDVENQFPVEIISENETYPCLLKKSNVELKTTSQSRLSLILYEGHSAFDCGMTLLRKKTVEFSEMVNAGSSIDISYKIDANKLITIYASVNGGTQYEFSTEE